MQKINPFECFLVSHVFDDGEDENDEEYMESIKIIEAISQQLGEDENGNRKQQMDFELEKKRIFDEAHTIFEEQLNMVKAQAKRDLEEAEVKARWDCDELKRSFEERLKEAEDNLEIQRREAKFERDDAVAELTEAHETQIKRIKDEFEESLQVLKANGPPMKRKHAPVEPDLNTVVLNGDLVSIAVPVTDQTKYTILETGELEFVEFLPYPEEKPKDGKGMEWIGGNLTYWDYENDHFVSVHPCGACEKEFSDEILGKFRRQRNGISYDFCSNSCSGWFDVINDAEILLKDDYTESEYSAWLEENGNSICLWLDSIDQC